MKKTTIWVLATAVSLMMCSCITYREVTVRVVDDSTGSPISDAGVYIQLLAPAFMKVGAGRYPSDISTVTDTRGECRFMAPSNLVVGSVDLLAAGYEHTSFEIRRDVFRARELEVRMLPADESDDAG